MASSRGAHLIAPFSSADVKVSCTSCIRAVSAKLWEHAQAPIARTLANPRPRVIALAQWPAPSVRFRWREGRVRARPPRVRSHPNNSPPRLRLAPVRGELPRSSSRKGPIARHPRSSLALPAKLRLKRRPQIERLRKRLRQRQAAAPKRSARCHPPSELSALRQNRRNTPTTMPSSMVGLKSAART